MLSANAANASGTDRAPVVVAGGGGGTAGWSWVGTDTQAQGLNASIEVANNSDNGYWSNEATRNDSHAHVPYNQHSMIVNTRTGETSSLTINGSIFNILFKRNET